MELKTWPRVFEDVWKGRKKFEIRKADRDFSEGQVVRLREYDPGTEKYSGRWLEVTITYLVSAGEWGLPSDICVWGFTELMRGSAEDGR